MSTNPSRVERTMTLVLENTRQLLADGKLDIRTVNPQILAAVQSGASASDFVRTTDLNAYRENSSTPRSGRVSLIIN